MALVSGYIIGLRKTIIGGVQCAIRARRNMKRKKIRPVHLKPRRLTTTLCHLTPNENILLTDSIHHVTCKRCLVVMFWMDKDMKE